MSDSLERRSVADWDGQRILPGESRNVSLNVGESYSGMTVTIPLHVRRGVTDGPTVLISAACHGDEINGTGAIRSLMNDHRFQLTAGAVIMVPVLNILGFDRHSRYLPDGRDLNRCFPGSRKGSLARRMARVIFDEIIARTDYGIDLHTAAVRRTNFPNVRADLTNPAVRRMAQAFGCALILHGEGPIGSLRREACAQGRPTIIMEGGEVWKVEPAIMDGATRGIRNVLRSLGMLAGELEMPPFQIELNQARWIRADRSGFLRFHATPGEPVRAGEVLATNASLLGEDIQVLRAPFDAVVLGVTTLPAVSPGEPVYHLARLDPEGLAKVEAVRCHGGPSHDLYNQLRENVAKQLYVVDRCQPGP